MHRRAPTKARMNLSGMNMTGSLMFGAYLAQGGPEIHAHRAFIDIDGWQVAASLIALHV